MNWLKHLFRHGPSSKTVADPNQDLVTTATHSVVLRLDPTKLDDPDLEVRWEIEKLLKNIQPALPFFDDGYGFARSSDAMFLTYATSDPQRFVDALIGICEREHVCGNRLGRAAMIGLAEEPELTDAGDGFDQFRIVYPAADRGKQLPD
ncbi:MAG TPA: hypothetical protein VFD82_15290 [Planctomycetota bacterium]|nr:hypothetical protein [Planctomycetota bacterium]